MGPNGYPMLNAGTAGGASVAAAAGFRSGAAAMAELRAIAPGVARLVLGGRVVPPPPPWMLPFLAGFVGAWWLLDWIYPAGVTQGHYGPEWERWCPNDYATPERGSFIIAHSHPCGGTWGKVLKTDWDRLLGTTMNATFQYQHSTFEQYREWAANKAYMEYLPTQNVRIKAGQKPTTLPPFPLVPSWTEVPYDDRRALQKQIEKQKEKVRTYPDAKQRARENPYPAWPMRAASGPIAARPGSIASGDVPAIPLPGHSVPTAAIPRWPPMVGAPPTVVLPGVALPGVGVDAPAISVPVDRPGITDAIPSVPGITYDWVKSSGIARPAARAIPDTYSPYPTYMRPAPEIKARFRKGMRLVGRFTETVDAFGALYKALPDDIRQCKTKRVPFNRAFQRVGYTSPTSQLFPQVSRRISGGSSKYTEKVERRHFRSPEGVGRTEKKCEGDAMPWKAKARAVLDNWKQIDPNKAVEELLKEAAGDRLYKHSPSRGKAMAALAKLGKKGVQVGPAL